MTSPSKITFIFGCILANLTIGCGQKEDPVCATNETQTCLCTATVVSAQVCREDRKGWQPCVCDLETDTTEITPNNPNAEPPTTYAFASRFDNSVSSVGYSGQTARHVLKHDLLSFIKSATDRIIRLELDPNEMMVWLTFFYEYNSELFGDEAHGYETSLPMMQYTYSDISPQKNLIAKLAGNDPVGQHVDWSQSGVIGWSLSDDRSPQGVVNWCFDVIRTKAASIDMTRSDTDGETLPIYVADNGIDCFALLDTFLEGAIAFSQTADDYLDDDLSNKGIRGGNEFRRFDGPFTDLEHFWDEGFGYFGSARSLDFGDLAAVSEGSAWDRNQDGLIDLLSEANFGAAVLAARLDISAVTRTNFTLDIFQALINGRHIISSANADLTMDEFNRLVVERNRAIDGWETVLVGSAIASMNRVIQTLKRPLQFENQGVVFENWSRMKGFLLSIQFNPRSKLDKTQLEDLHQRIGAYPMDPNDSNATTYIETLNQIKAELGNVYELDSANLGDEAGSGGWLDE